MRPKDNNTADMFLSLIHISAGAGIENVVKTTVFITNMADFPLVNAEYSKVFAENPPARSCVAVKELPLGGLVEIEVLAVV